MPFDTSFIFPHRAENGFLSNQQTVHVTLLLVFLLFFLFICSASPSEVTVGVSSVNPPQGAPNVPKKGALRAHFSHLPAGERKELNFNGKNISALHPAPSKTKSEMG